MDQLTDTRLTAGDVSGAALDGATIYGPDDAKVGTISHLHGAGPTASVIVDVGGFLGIGAKPVSVNLSQIQLMRDSGGTVYGVTQLTKSQLEGLPEHTD